jgi:photosystem II stability/assembly factor-like uncharacterized protein
MSSRRCLASRTERALLMIRRFSPFFLALLVWAASRGPAPRFDAWKIIGPGGAGGMFLPTISPHDPNTVLELCDMTGAYISRDGGQSWRMFNLRSRASAFAFDPKDSRVIYAGNIALWRSQDSGKTWSMIFPDPKKNTVERMRDDHAAGVLSTDDPAYSGGRAGYIAVDPDDTSRVYAVFSNQRGAWLIFSNDGGATWSRLREFPGERIHLIYFDAGLRIVGESGVYTSNGDGWEHLAGPAGERFQFASGGAGLLYATSGAGIHLSEDGGRTWRIAPDTLPGSPRFLAVACSSQHPRNAYVAFAKMKEYFGIAKTSDGGGHWNVVYQETHQRAPNVQRAWIEDFYGGTGPIRDLAVAPGNPDICFD